MTEHSLSTLASNDSRLRTLLFVAGVFIIVPPIFSGVEHGARFFQPYVHSMLYAFSWPLLVLLGLVSHRLVRLSRLINKGVQFDGAIQTVRSGRHFRKAVVRFSGQAGDRTVEVYVPSTLAFDLYEGSRVVLLVDDQEAPKMAVIVGPKTTAK